MYEALQDRLFELGLEAQDVVEGCGFGNHNVYTRFGYFTRHGIKELILVHRMELAKRLLKRSQVPIGKIALAVGRGGISCPADLRRKAHYTTADFSHPVRQAKA